mmetsp:Transcript_21866/g.35143  ORF Transcript_21866/g.35143 Transcript_21866/m.35143 type:complete len:269 (-) Transcript_21866:273-1079(-)
MICNVRDIGSTWCYRTWHRTRMRHSSRRVWRCQMLLHFSTNLHINTKLNLAKFLLKITQQARQPHMNERKSMPRLILPLLFSIIIVVIANIARVAIIEIIQMNRVLQILSRFLVTIETTIQQIAIHGVTECMKRVQLHRGTTMLQCESTKLNETDIRIGMYQRVRHKRATRTLHRATVIALQQQCGRTFHGHRQCAQNTIQLFHAGSRGLYAIKLLIAATKIKQIELALQQCNVHPAHFRLAHDLLQLLLCHRIRDMIDVDVVECRTL